MAACRAWPHGAPSPTFAQRVVSSIPTLLISGGRDPVTPPDLADLAATTLSHSERYLNPEAGHAALDGDSRARMAAFFLEPNANPDAVTPPRRQASPSTRRQ